METALTELRWFKSSASSAAGCVEIAHLPGGGVAVRDSKDRSKTRIPAVFRCGYAFRYWYGCRNHAVPATWLGHPRLMHGRARRPSGAALKMWPCAIGPWDS